MPETIESFEPLAAQLLSDRHHGVLLTGVVMMLDVCELHPASVETYRRYAADLAMCCEPLSGVQAAGPLKLRMQK